MNHFFIQLYKLIIQSTEKIFYRKYNIYIDNIMYWLYNTVIELK